MRIERDQKLFVGVRVDSKLREALALCPSRDKAYFDGSDPRYLCMVRGGEDTFVGKTVPAGAPVNSLEDVKRNILSLLARLHGRRNEDDVKIFGHSEVEASPVVPKEYSEPGSDPYR